MCHLVPLYWSEGIHLFGRYLQNSLHNQIIALQLRGKMCIIVCELGKTLNSYDVGCVGPKILKTNTVAACEIR